MISMRDPRHTCAIAETLAYFSTMNEVEIKTIKVQTLNRAQNEHFETHDTSKSCIHLDKLLKYMDHCCVI